MAINNSKHIPNLELASNLFEEIATSASQIDTFFYHSLGDLGPEAEKINNQLDIMRMLVARIGWMADLGCKKLTGCESIKGDAEHWLLFPRYVSELREAEAV